MVPRGLLPVHVRRQPWYEKFLEDTTKRTLTDSDQRVLEYQRRTIAIICWNIEVGDTADGDATQHEGVIRLPALVVTFANH